MDVDVLRLQERVLLALELGESHFREFKSACEGLAGKKTPRPMKEISQDIGRTLVAFANADGGELLVGVEDDGEITVMDATDQQVQTLLDSPNSVVHKDTPLPPTRSVRLLFEGKTVLYFSVSKGTNYVYLTADGRCIQRRDRESVPMATEAIRFSRTETISREYDRAFVDNAQIADLDFELVGHVAEHLSKGMSVEKCLQHIELAEFDGSRLRLRRAALLLFGKDPLRWHPRLQVRILKVEGTDMGTGDKYNVKKDEEVTDNILNLIETSWEFLRPHLTETRFSRDALFKTQIIYPELACREALINAIAHRDYSNEGRGIEVRVFTDRMEIVSPGQLLSSISVDDLKQKRGVHESRNSLVSRVPRELGYMRELGEGIRRIYELMQSNDLTPPEFKSGNGLFTITLSHKFIYTEEEKIWLDSFRSYDLSRDERTIVRLGYGGRLISPKAIWDSCGIVDTDYYRRLVESLRNKGILQRKVARSAAYGQAAKKGIPKKSVPQFVVAVPDPNKQIRQPAVEVPGQETSDDADYSRIYVTNLPFETQERELEDFFQQFGDVADVSIPKYINTLNNRGYGFIEFETLASAREALAKSGQVILSGRRLQMREARPITREPGSGQEVDANVQGQPPLKTGPGGSRKVFIANLPVSANQQALLEVLTPYGNVLQLNIPVDPNTGQQRTFAFATFADSESARNAIKHSGKIMLAGRVIYLQEYIQKPASRS